MFAYIKGTIAHASTGSVVVDAGGIGYKIYIPVSAYSRLPGTGSEVLLHTVFIVREVAQTLYGFLNIHERDFFEALLNVTGVGPKLALALIGHMPLYDLQRAISQGDIPTLCRIPGIGKKGAERLIIEMRDKVQLTHDPGDLAVAIPGNARMQVVNDAMSALINLGYNQQSAQNAIKKTLKDFPENADLATLITDALKYV